MTKKTKSNDLLPFAFDGTIKIPDIRVSCTVKRDEKDGNKMRYYCWIEDYFFKVEWFMDKKEEDFKHLNLEIARKGEFSGMVNEDDEWDFRDFHDDPDGVPMVNIFASGLIFLN